LNDVADAHEHRITSQDSPEESNAYKQFYDACQARDYKRAVEAAEQYLESYPDGRYTSYLKKWLEAAAKQPFKENPPPDPRLEALAIAASEGITRVLSSLVQSLIEDGGDINMEIKDGQTALMLAAAEGNRDAVMALIRKGANVNKKEKKHGFSALIYAVWRGDAATVQALIDSGADVNVKDIDEASALDIAIVREHADVVKLLRKARAHQ
jgi:ankyrin repeat protein